MPKVHEITCLINKFTAHYPEYIENAWDFREVQDIFEFNHFAAGFAFVTRIKDQVTGSLNFREFEGSRVYFDFRIN